MTKDFDGEAVLITGAGRGIGRAMAERFALEGAPVALLARSANELEEVAKGIRERGGRALPIATDVCDAQAVCRAVSRVEAELGPIGALINNAGSFACIGPLWEIDPEAWWRDCEVNLRGPLLMCHAAVPALIARREGLIINVIGGGTGNPSPYDSGYASSKAGLMRLTESLAAETREHGIAVVALGPGFVQTRMTELQIETEAGRRWIPSSAQAIAQGRDIPPTQAADLAFELSRRRRELLPLTGRLFTAGDDLDEIFADAEEIIAANRRTLRFCS